MRDLLKVIFGLMAGGCCFGCASSVPTSTVENRRAVDSLPRGVWREAGKTGYFVAIERDSLILAYGGEVREIMAVLAVAPGRLRACRFGRDSVFSWRYEGETLVLEDLDRRETHRLARSAIRPPALDLDLQLPEPGSLESGTVDQIRRDLSARVQREQDRLKAQAQPSRSPRETPSFLEPAGPLTGTDLALAEITTDNSRYIRQLLLRVGWIDVGRFGYSTSKAAFLLVQHSWDAPLMAAVLPALEKDVKAGLMEADAYALLFDRLQLAEGRPQRFGSQVANEGGGALVVLPVEEPETVDDRRAALGMIPLEDYVRVFGASEVRFSQQCQAGAGYVDKAPR